MSTSAESALAAQLIPLLTRQLELYRTLQQLAERQRALVTREDTQPLLALLAERRQIVDALTRMSRELAPVQAQWRQNREKVAAKEQAHIESLLGESSSILQTVLEHDAEDARQLAARKTTTAGQLERIGTGRNALAAYHDASRAPRGSMIGTDETA
jgi:hypothetical protein